MWHVTLCNVCDSNDQIDDTVSVMPHLSFIFALIVKNVPSEVSCISCLTEVRLSFVGATF